MVEVIPLLLTIIQFYSLVLLARIILTWIPNIDRSNVIVQFLFQITDPVLEPIRRALPATEMIDFSPLIVFVVLRILQSVLMQMT